MLNQWFMSLCAYGNAGHATGNSSLPPYIHLFSAHSVMTQVQSIYATI